MALLYTDDSGRVMRIHYMPERLSENERQAAAMETDSFPEKPDYDPEQQRVDLFIANGVLEWQISQK